MKKLVTAFALCAATISAMVVDSQNIVGYTSGVSLVGTNYNMLAAPFTSVGSTNAVKIKNMFSDNSVFTAGYTFEDADYISIWENGGYTRDYIYSAYINAWASTGSAFDETEDTIAAGTAFWLYRQGANVANLTMAGQVVTANVDVNLVAANYNFVSNPFAGTLKIKNMFVNNSLFTAGYTFEDADYISLWEDGGYTRDYIYSAYISAWASTGSAFDETEDTIIPGQGFWLFRQGSAVTVTLDCPY